MRLPLLARRATALLDRAVPRPAPLTRVQEFLDNPARFMRKNHVAYRGDPPDDIVGGIGKFVLVQIDERAEHISTSRLPLRRNRPAQGASFHIRAADKLANKDVPGTPQPFNAYWSGFVADGKAMCSLPATGPTIMLTPALTGCAVACVAGQNNTASFSHYNNKVASTLVNRVLPGQDIVAIARADYPGLHGLSVMSSEYYRDEGKGRAGWETTVIGARTERSGWSFWVQHGQQVHSKVHQILAVEELTPGLRISRP